MGTPHKATPGQWGAIEGYKDDSYLCVLSCILELRDRLAAAEQRIEALVAASPSAPADHFRDASEMVATDAELERVFYEAEGTAAADGFRALYDLGLHHGAVQSANSFTEQSPAVPAPAGGLVERVSKIVANGGDPADWQGEARAAILAVAEWLNKGAEAHLGGGVYWSRRLREEAQRHG